MIHEISECRVVTRPGVVIRARATAAEIEIVQYSACSSCTLKGVCVGGESASRLVSARTETALKPGTRVELSMEERWGLLGTLVAFVVPLVLVVTVFFATRPHVGREEWAGLLAVGSLVPYYLGIYRLRDRFARLVTFYARPLSKEGA